METLGGLVVVRRFTHKSGVDADWFDAWLTRISVLNHVALRRGGAMNDAGWYAVLGVRPLINAAATKTSLGGSLMPRPVLEAMSEAAGSFVDLVELQERIGARLAELTHNEAGYVVSGAAAGITLAVAACIAGTDARLVAAFPHLEGVTKREVVVEKTQRNGFDYAARLTGARIVEVDGTASGLEGALSERTACVLCFAGTRFGTDVSSVERVVELAHPHGVPVIVDAAAQIRPFPPSGDTARRRSRRRDRQRWQGAAGTAV